MSSMRRSQSVAPPTKRSSSLTGFVRLEATSTTATSPSSPSRKRSNNDKDKHAAAAMHGARWLYAVLSRDTLRCFARRADHKLQHPPVAEIVLDLVPSIDHPKPFSFDHECLYVRCATTAKALTIRLHEAAKINQWVTALYYQALAATASMALPVANNTASSDHTSPRKVSKTVSFTEVPDVSFLPDDNEDPIDKTELFYSKKDYAEFLQRWKDDVLNPKSAAMVRISERCK